MRTRSKVILLVVTIAPLGVIAYSVNGFVKGPSYALPTTTTTTLPAGIPVGFNTERTEFVLPHNLGYLPAPELALAKADPAYAAGLANAGDWTPVPMVAPSVSSSASAPEPPPITLWAYSRGVATGSSAPSGESSQQSVIDIKAGIVSMNDSLELFGEGGPATRLSSSSVKVHASTVNALFVSEGAVPYRTELLAPSTLEVQAAPVGTLAVGGTSLPAFCVPTPEAFLAQGFLSAAKVSTPKTEPVMTAGPSTVFAGSLGTAGSAPTGVLLYDQGVGSCANFR